MASKKASVAYRLTNKIQHARQSRQTRQSRKRKHNNAIENANANANNPLNKYLSANNIAKGKEDLFYQLIQKNVYVDFCVKNEQRDSNSFYSLITRDLLQSDAIKLGIAIEKIFSDLILTNPQIKNIRKANTKGEKETDHLFLNETANPKVVYYAEVKSNLKLDTEKRKATIKKIKDITDELKKEHQDCEVKSFLFAPRYLSTTMISADFIRRYTDIKLIGVHEYLREFGITYQFADEDDYKEKLNYLSQRLFECVGFEEIDKLELKRSALAEDFLQPIPNAPKKEIPRIARTLNSLLDNGRRPSETNNLAKQLQFNDNP